MSELTLPDNVNRAVGHGLVGESGLTGTARDAFGPRLQSLAERLSDHIKYVAEVSGQIRTERCSQERKLELRQDLAGTAFRRAAELLAPSVDAIVTAFQDAEEKLKPRALEPNDLGMKLGSQDTGSEAAFRAHDAADRVRLARESVMRLEGPQQALAIRSAFGALEATPDATTVYGLTALPSPIKRELEQNLHIDFDELLAVFWSRRMPVEAALRETWTQFGTQTYYNAHAVLRALEGLVGLPAGDEKYAIARVTKRLAEALRLEPLPTNDAVAEAAAGTKS